MLVSLFSSRILSSPRPPAVGRFSRLPRLFALPFAFVLLAPAATGQTTETSASSIQSLIREGQYDQAIQATQAALKRRPSDHALWTLQGLACALKNDNPCALAAFDRALRIAPAYPPALKGEIQILYQTGDKRAILLLERLLQADSGDSTAREMLATLEWKQGNCQAATAQFERIPGSIATHPPSLEAYGDCLVQLKKLDEAAPVFEKLVPLLPGQSYPRYDLAVVYAGVGRNSDAIQTLQPLLTPDQSDPDILSLAAQAYEATGDTPRAASLMRQAIVLSPQTPDYYVDFAAICLDHDSFQVGIDMLNAGLQRISGVPSLYISRGLLYAQLGEFDQAEADFTQAERLDTSQSLSLYAADLAEMQRNDPARALASVRLQLKSHPDSPLLELVLAQLLMNPSPAPGSPDYKEAKRYVLAALKTKPDLVSAHNLLASMYMHEGRYDLAIQECRTVLKYAPDDETALYHLVISLRHAGQTADLPPLVKRLAELHQQSLKQETDRKRFRLVEGNPSSSDAPSAGHP